MIKLNIKYQSLKGPVLVFLALIAFVQAMGSSEPVRAARANQALNDSTTKLSNEETRPRRIQSGRQYLGQCGFRRANFGMGRNLRPIAHDASEPVCKPD